MRLRIFDALEARLRLVRSVGNDYIFCRPNGGTSQDLPGNPAILHYDLWNEVTARLSQSRPFRCPAVFVEFFPVTWSPLQRNAVHADFTLRLHIVTSTLAPSDTQYRSEALARLRLVRAVKAALADFSAAADDSGRSFSRFKYLGSTTDHNHEQICEDIEEWQTHCIDCSGVDEGYILTPKNVTLDTGDIFADAFGEEMV